MTPDTKFKGSNSAARWEWSRGPCHIRSSI